MTQQPSDMKREMKASSGFAKKLVSENARAAKRILGPQLVPRMTAHLKVLGRDYGFSVGAGELQIINGNWYVTHTGLLRLARRKRCRGIHVEAVDSLCDSAASRFVLKATVFPSKDSAGFVGYGDADPSNVSLLVRGAEMRIAETRAVNRALRKAYGIGICSVEEIGSNPATKASTEGLAMKLIPRITDALLPSTHVPINCPSLRSFARVKRRNPKLKGAREKGHSISFRGLNSHNQNGSRCPSSSFSTESCRAVRSVRGRSERSRLVSPVPRRALFPHEMLKNLVHIPIDE
jgi:hypothetical protein